MTVSHLDRAGTVPNDGFRPRRHTGAKSGGSIRIPFKEARFKKPGRKPGRPLGSPPTAGPQPRPPVIVSTPSAGPNSVAACDRVRAVDKRRLTRNEGQLSAVDLRSIEDGLRRVLEL